MFNLGLIQYCRYSYLKSEDQASCLAARFILIARQFLFPFLVLNSGSPALLLFAAGESLSTHVKSIVVFTIHKRLPHLLLGSIDSIFIILFMRLVITVICEVRNVEATIFRCSVN